MSLNQAQHNKSVAELLDGCEIDCPDWVVTTCYYAAMNYVYSTIFPKITPVPIKERPDQEPKLFNKFEQYYDHRLNVIAGQRLLSKHNATVDLVREIYPENAAAFKELKNDCHKARYSRYKLSDHADASALETMREFADICSPTPAEELSS